MREQYPFFRDGDEQAQAVIGEEAVNADLDGDYQKPYAVLTQKRLYCKNEQGNFITDASALRSAGKGLLPGQNWFLWAVVGCVSLALVLLCLWYWGMGGRWRTENINYDAQMYIDNYHALEEKVPEYEQTVQDYENAEKEIEELQKELEEMDHNAIMQEANKVHREADRLQAALSEATAALFEQQSAINDAEKEIEGYNRSIAEAEEQIKNTDTAKNNEIKSQIESLQSRLSYLNKWKNAEYSEFTQFEYMKKSNWRDTMMYTYRFDERDFSNKDQIRRYCREEAESTQRKISDLWESYVDIEYVQDSIEWNRQYIADSETYLAEHRQKLEEARKGMEAAREEVQSYQPTVAAVDKEMGRVEAIQTKLAQKQSSLDSAALSNAQSQLQKFKDSKADYKNAQSVQRKVNLFLPCLLAFAACVVVFIILTALKRAKPAVIAALAAACVGLVCVSLSDINLPNIQGFGWGDYYIMPPPLSIALRILPILAVILGVLALWWNRKKTVFQIVHNTGAFSFTPSVYPAEELKQFSEQVRRMQEGETDGE